MLQTKPYNLMVGYYVTDQTLQPYGWLLCYKLNLTTLWLVTMLQAKLHNLMGGYYVTDQTLQPYGWLLCYRPNLTTLWLVTMLQAKPHNLMVGYCVTGQTSKPYGWLLCYSLRYCQCGLQCGPATCFCLNILTFNRTILLNMQKH